MTWYTGAWLLLVAGLLHTATPHRVLVATHQYGSHIMLARAAADGLLKQGHEVYFILSDYTKTPKGMEEDGFKILKFHTKNETRSYNYPGHADNYLNMALGRIPEDLAMGSIVSGDECADMEADTKFMSFIKGLQIDLILVDVIPIGSCLYFLPMYLKVPFVTLSPQVELDPSRVPLLPSIVPFYVLEQSDRMPFHWRFLNAIIHAAAVTIVTIPALSPFPAISDTTLLRKYNTDPAVTSWNDMGRKSSLYVVMSGPVMGYPAPTLPHVISLEGLLCSPGKALPDRFQTLVSESVGTIVVSFGSTIRVLPVDLALKFLDAFRQMKELVIWRYDGKIPGDMPPNVKIFKWLPQNDLLAHPKTKLFITHSGNNGQYEAVYHGVPMLAFPVFGDQHFNAHRIFVHGYGLKCDLKTFSSDEVLDKMTTILNTPSFAEKTQKASRILKSQPLTPREKITYWLGHTLEFGTDHLRTSGLDMPWYSYFMLDVIAAFYLLTTVLLSVSVFSCVCVYRKCCTTNHKKVKVN